MARRRRAKRKSTRRKTARRKTTRRRSTTRRASARRTRARRPKRTTRRRRTKGLARKTQKQILTAAAIVVGILILLALLGPHYVRVTYYGGEVGRNAVSGQVTSAAIGAAGRGTIHVQSYNTGKIYTFYTGVRTDYNIRGRYPARGDSVRVNYINDRGYLKATYIRIR
jgi:hypothetical protein